MTIRLCSRFFQDSRVTPSGPSFYNSVQFKFALWWAYINQPQHLNHLPAVLVSHVDKTALTHQVQAI